eukprot:4680085-Pleurochrysis_carterae.AAC.1
MAQPASPTTPVSALVSEEPVAASVISEPPPKAHKGRGTALEVAQKAFALAEGDWIKAQEKLCEVEAESLTMP